MLQLAGARAEFVSNQEGRVRASAKTMPNLKDIVDVAQALQSTAVRVVEDRCVVVRNRNSSCRRCVRACPADAITVRGNNVTLDNAACVSCGACTVVWKRLFRWTPPMPSLRPVRRVPPALWTAPWS